MRNDPARLEAEAKELIEQHEKARKESSAEEIPEEPEELIEEPPSEPEEMVEAVADEEVPESESRGDDLDLRLAKAEKAMKGAQRRMTQATQEAAELRKQNETLVQNLAGLKGQLVDVERDNERLSAVREEYPDIASPILDELKRTQAEVEQHSEALEEGRQQRFEEERRRDMAEHFARIQTIHPDVQEVTNTSDWAIWLEEQDGQTQAWIEQGTSNDVNAVLSRYKSEMNIRPPTPQEESLERAKAVAEPKMPKARKTQTSAGKKRSFTVEEITRMPNDQFEKHQEEILEAMNEGRIRQ